MKVVSRIATFDALEELLAGETNRFQCHACGYLDYLEVPVLLEKVNHLSPAVVFLPVGHLEDFGHREWVYWNHIHMTVVHSMDELVLQARLRLVISKHHEDRVVRLRSIEIPSSVHDRIRGSYRKGKLKTIWFASTLFDSEGIYTEEEVNRTIAHALSRLDDCPPTCDVAHIRSALCELKLLYRTPDGRRYWKDEVPEE